MGRAVRSSRTKLRFSRDRVLGRLTLFLPSYWASLARCGQRRKDEYKSMGKVKHKVNKITLPGGRFESRHVRLHRLAGGRRGILSPTLPGYVR